MFRNMRYIVCTLNNSKHKSIKYLVHKYSNLTNKVFKYVKRTNNLYLLDASNYKFSLSILNHSSIIDNNTVESLINKLISKYSINEQIPFNTKIMPHGTHQYFENLLKQVIAKEKEKEELEELKKKEIDDELKKLANEDIKELNETLSYFKTQIFEKLLNLNNASEMDEIYLEVSAGVGGQEAMLFAQDLMEMYQNYCSSNGWNVDLVNFENTPLGGIRHACLLINGVHSYTKLKYEGGIHRVQRVPKTEKAGRIHTSTASVAILPVPSEIMIKIKDKDLKIDTMRASGAGGQHVNKIESAIRITHIPTGIVAECQTSRAQESNRKEAMKKLRARMYEREVDKQESKISTQKKLQVGTKARSEKIRTYNFHQGRITDHRVGMTIHNIEDFLIGGTSLEKLISKLIDVGNTEEMLALLEAD